MARPEVIVRTDSPKLSGPIRGRYPTPAVTMTFLVYNIHGYTKNEKKKGWKKGV